MKVELYINTSKLAAYDEASEEVAALLRQVADTIERHPNFSPGFSFPIAQPMQMEAGYFTIHEEDKNNG